MRYKNSVLNRKPIVQSCMAKRSGASFVSRYSALVVGSMAMAICTPALSDTLRCADVLYLVEQSTTNFASIVKEFEGELV